jgi:Ca2+-binding RTX toxin-like protein
VFILPIPAHPSSLFYILNALSICIRCRQWLMELSRNKKSTTVITTTILGVTLVICSTVTVGLLLLQLSPILIQSAEAATTVSDAGNCFIGTPTIVGTDNDDVIQGTEGRDYIVGLGGNDRIYGNGGNDFLCGGNGDDRLYGGKGNDLLNSGAGADRVFGEEDKDRLFAGAGNDEIYGGPGDEVDIDGGPGDDLIDGGPGNDGTDDGLITGAEGNDRIYGGPGDDRLFGDSHEEENCENDDNEPVPCFGGNDKLYGNAGDDFLNGGLYNDFGDGGPNFDTCVFVEDTLNCEAWERAGKTHKHVSQKGFYSFYAFARIGNSGISRECVSLSQEPQQL